jgi:hypothetical protein
LNKAFGHFEIIKSNNGDCLRKRVGGRKVMLRELKGEENDGLAIQAEKRRQSTAAQ